MATSRNGIMEGLMTVEYVHAEGVYRVFAASTDISKVSVLQGRKLSYRVNHRGLHINLSDGTVGVLHDFVDEEAMSKMDFEVKDGKIVNDYDPAIAYESIDELGRHCDDKVYRNVPIMHSKAIPKRNWIMHVRVIVDGRMVQLRDFLDKHAMRPSTVAQVVHRLSPKRPGRGRRVVHGIVQAPANEFDIKLRELIAAKGMRTEWVKIDGPVDADNMMDSLVESDEVSIEDMTDEDVEGEVAGPSMDLSTRLKRKRDEIDDLLGKLDTKRAKADELSALESAASEKATLANAAFEEAAAKALSLEVAAQKAKEDADKVSLELLDQQKQCRDFEDFIDDMFM